MQGTISFPYSYLARAFSFIPGALSGQRGHVWRYVDAGGLTPSRLLIELEQRGCRDTLMGQEESANVFNSQKHLNP